MLDFSAKCVLTSKPLICCVSKYSDSPAWGQVDPKSVEMEQQPGFDSVCHLSQIIVKIPAPWCEIWDGNQESVSHSPTSLICHLKPSQTISQSQPLHPILLGKPYWRGADILHKIWIIRYHTLRNVVLFQRPKKMCRDIENVSYLMKCLQWYA